VWVGAEGRCQGRIGIDVRMGEIRVDGSAYDFGQGETFGLGDLVDAAALVGGQVHLGARGGHTAQHTAAAVSSSIEKRRPYR